MKIQWLNDERTRAIVTRGWWRWKRQAEVRRISEYEWYQRSGLSRWRFVPSDDQAKDLSSALERRRKADEKRARRDRLNSNWLPVGQLPEARVRRLP